MQRRGFSALTAVQKAVLDTDSDGRNLRISSQTGSGKTVAIGLALAEDLIQSIEGPGRGPYALVITPTRELAAQVKDELTWLFEDIDNARVTVVTGGTDILREQRALSKSAPILVGTPGRLLDHLRRRSLDVSNIRHVILDEADQMLEMGFKEELDGIVDQLPEDRRSHLVSATFPNDLRRLSDRFQHDALHLEGTALGAANVDIAHTATICGSRDRYAALVNNLLLLEGDRCLVFVKRRADATELAELLCGDGLSAMPFSGELAQTQRTRTLNAFKNGIVRTLVATDVAARGIDVPDIATVVHYDLPFDAEAYTHRSGRTGRAGQKGNSILLVPPRAERRVQRLLQQARVEAEWSPIPEPKKIKKTLRKRMRRGFRASLEAHNASETELAYAASLLQENDPSALVACLLEMAQPKLPREPLDVAPPRERKPQRERRTDDVRYFVSWGRNDGATIPRLVAHLCRRSGIEGASIGAVSVGPSSSSVYIAADVANEFEAKVARPDRNDPDIRIQRFRGDGGGSERSDRSDRPRNTSRRPRFERPKKRPFNKGRRRHPAE